MSARRFLWRWNGRTLRRDRRQYAVIFAMIATATALSTAAILAAFNLTEPPEGEGFGRGQVVASVIGDSEIFEQALIDQGHQYGTIESSQVIIPGATDRVLIKVHDPTNHITEPLLALLEGRWPAGADEVAVTDQVPIDEATVGDSFEINGRLVQVVGLVENPTNLNAEFILATDLEALGVPVPQRLLQFLIDAKRQDVVLPPGISGLNSSDRGGLLSVRSAITITVNVVSALAMLEVALLVSAGFAVIARRRSRQYGLLAAVGATPRQIRTSATMSGTILGLLAALVGALAGIALGALIVAPLESKVAHRITFSVPWWSVVPNLALSVLVASLAARWPARAMAKQPVVQLLASTPSRRQPVGWSAAVGVVIAATGGVAIALGFTRIDPLLAIVGVFLGPVGLLMMAPLLVQQIGRLAGRLPLPARMGGRAAARYNRRSASVVAALALALAIPVAMAVTTTSLDRFNAMTSPNLETNSAVLWYPGAEQNSPWIPAQLVDDPPVADDVNDLLTDAFEVVPGATLAPIEVAIAPFALTEREDFQRVGPQPAYQIAQALRPITEATCGGDCDIVGWGERDENGDSLVYKTRPAWIATPPLLELLGVDATPLDDPAVNAVAIRADLFLYGGFEVDTGIDYDVRDGMVFDETIPTNSSLAPLLISPDWVAAEGYRTATAGWMVMSPSPLTVEQRAEITELVGSVLVPEFHRPPPATAAIRAIAITLGILAGLGIAAAAVNLLASEVAGDLRILRSVGAEPRTARRMAAAMGGLLAGAGALLAVFIGYLALIPQLANRATDYPFVVPWPTLLALLVLFPLLAAGVGWLAGGRHHQNLAKPQ